MSKLADEIARLNEQHAVIMINGKVRVACWEPSRINKGIMIAKFASVADMKNFYSNKRVRVGSDEDSKSVPVFDLWMRSRDRATVIGVTMDPTAGRIVDGQLNLCRGLAVEPKQGDWSLLRRHIEEVVCRGVRAHMDYVIKWLAWRLQHPTTPPEVALVMSGLKGTGKGLLGRALCRIFGAHAIHISDRKHLAGSFNAHMLQACMVFADEAYWPGDKAAEGNLKRLITEPTLFVELKGVDAYEVPNHTATIIAGNEEWLVPASDDERRYAAFRVADHHKQDGDYFKPLFAEMNNGGLEAFLFDALAMDLGDWHPREDIPQTDALKAQQEVSSDPHDRWLGAILEAGVLPFSVLDDGIEKRVVHDRKPDMARSELLWKHATRQPGLAHWTQPAFWRYLSDHGVSRGQREAKGNMRTFPPLPEMRKAWLARHPWWPPFDDMDEHWRMPADEKIDRQRRGLSDPAGHLQDGGWE